MVSSWNCPCPPTRENTLSSELVPLFSVPGQFSLPRDTEKGIPDGPGLHRSPFALGVLPVPSLCLKPAQPHPLPQRDTIRTWDQKQLLVFPPKPALFGMSFPTPALHTRQTTQSNPISWLWRAHPPHRQRAQHSTKAQLLSFRPFQHEKVFSL